MDALIPEVLAPVVFTDTERAEGEQLLQEVDETVVAMTRHYVDLAIKFHRIRSKGFYRLRGFESFNTYCGSLRELSGSSLYAISKVAEYLLPVVDESKVRSLPQTKAVLLAAYVHDTAATPTPEILAMAADPRTRPSDLAAVLRGLGLRAKLTGSTNYRPFACYPEHRREIEQYKQYMRLQLPPSLKGVDLDTQILLTLFRERFADTNPADMQRAAAAVLEVEAARRRRVSETEVIVFLESLDNDLLSVGEIAARMDAPLNQLRHIIENNHSIVSEHRFIDPTVRGRGTNTRPKYLYGSKADITRTRELLEAK